LSVEKGRRQRGCEGREGTKAGVRAEFEMARRPRAERGEATVRGQRDPAAKAEVRAGARGLRAERA
jgi:hypothetical protein